MRIIFFAIREPEFRKDTSGISLTCFIKPGWNFEWRGRLVINSSFEYPLARPMTFNESLHEFLLLRIIPF
jgi:hypothetical protein